jgi:hypothetical protein
MKLDVFLYDGLESSLLNRNRINSRINLIEQEAKDRQRSKVAEAFEQIKKREHK